MRRSKENSQNSRNLYIKSLVLERRGISNQKRKFGFFRQRGWNNWEKMKWNLYVTLYTKIHLNSPEIYNWEWNTWKKYMYRWDQKELPKQGKKSSKAKDWNILLLKAEWKLLCRKKSTSWTKTIKNKYP